MMNKIDEYFERWSLLEKDSFCEDDRIDLERREFISPLTQDEIAEILRREGVSEDDIIHILV